MLDKAVLVLLKHYLKLMARILLFDQCKGEKACFDAQNAHPSLGITSQA